MVEAPILPLVLALLLPPLAVYTRFGLGRWFWVDVALTILGWLPGVICALILLLRPPVGNRALA